MTVYNFGKTFILLLVLAIFSGCLEETGIYSCTYESRSTGCGGKGWKSWKTECYEFDIEDYKEGWTPERVCNKFTGSDTHCAGGCCINSEYRNTRLSRGGMFITYPTSNLFAC
jgi:hypothetical protein